MSTIHEIYMRRAISLARKGTRLAYPNPSVGAVIVCDGKIIGEGYTDSYGGPHAEVNAINAVQDTSLLPHSSLYVTLEPCSHYGKTPPCASLIEAKKIPNIYIGCVDTFSEVSGKGIEQLLKAGRNIQVGVLEKECLELHKRFLTYHNKQRPYIVLKWAETKDGFIDTDRVVANIKDAQPTWISNDFSKQQVHQMRALEHAIMVGTNTALKDNPSLNVRTTGGVSPIRILIDKSMRIPEAYNLYNNKVSTIVFTEQPQENVGTVVFEQLDFSKNIIPQVLKSLYDRNIQSVIVEGGKQLLNSFIQTNVWDEAYVFVGESVFTKGVSAPRLHRNPVTETQIGGDVLKHYRAN